MLVHHLFAGGSAELLAERQHSIVDRGMPAIGKYVVQGGIQNKRVAIFLVAAEVLLPVVRGLKDFSQHFAGIVEMHAINIFDVGGTPPASHEGVGGSSAVLVGKDDGVLKNLPLFRGQLFVIHQ